MREQMGSATIFQFPVGGRGGQRPVNIAKQPPEETSLNEAALAVGESWYHAEAIRDDRLARH